MPNERQAECIRAVRQYLVAREGLAMTENAILNGINADGHGFVTIDTTAALKQLERRNHVKLVPDEDGGPMAFEITPEGVKAAWRM